MFEIECCPECAVPRQIPDGHQWLDNGVIVHKGDPGLRMVFMECENLDPLFQGVAQLIGVPIENIIINAERKGNRDYFNPLIPREIKDMIRSGELSLDPIIDAMIITGKVNGIGRLELESYQHDLKDDDYTSIISHDAHCLPIVCGDIAGGCEAVTEKEHSLVSHREISSGVHEITAAVSGFDADMEGRLERMEYHLKQGDIEFERCSTCGGPLDFSIFRWDLDKGIIRNPSNGRRIAIVHPSVIDPIFKEIEQELGDEIPSLTVEAQRLFTRTGFYSAEEIRDENAFRNQLALRGMGNLKELKLGKKGLHVRLENACMHLMVVGMLQGLYELAFDRESQVEWALSEQGDLEVDAVPKS